MGRRQRRAPRAPCPGLEPDDRLLLFTDDPPAAESMRRVSRVLVEHQQAGLTDDATMLLVEWSPQG